PTMTYVSDTSGIAPTVQNNVVTWSLPDLGFLERHDWRIIVRVPEAALGMRLPIELRLSAANTIATAQTDVMIAELHYFPVIAP
ncbi:MAG TPA: hypothetical protein VFX76_18720, partial [Roseiflexaceae bacterium]|nr:hypothetical protein [Roseiflexaceae bacterium]